MKITMRNDDELSVWGGQCPAQFEFIIDDKYKGYVRYRHGHFTLALEDENDNSIFGELIYEEYCGDAFDGYMTWEEVKEKIEYLDVEVLRKEMKEADELHNINMNNKKYRKDYYIKRVERTIDQIMYGCSKEEKTREMTRSYNHLEEQWQQKQMESKP